MAFAHSLLFLDVSVLPFWTHVQTHSHHLDLGLLPFLTPSRIFIILSTYYSFKKSPDKRGATSLAKQELIFRCFNSWFCGLSTTVRLWNVTLHNERNIKWTQRNSPLLPTEIQFPDPQEARRPQWPALYTHILCAGTICSLPSPIIILAIYFTGRDVPLKLRLG